MPQNSYRFGYDAYTVLIGTSGQPGSFSEQVVRSMVQNTTRPVILPLSNPTSKTEALPEDICAWTDGKALVATGSPFAPVSFGGKTVRVGQCNNVFVFPGVGLGVLASGAREVLPQFFTAAARAVSACVSPADMKKGLLLPPVSALGQVSQMVALEVGMSAIREGVARPCAFSTYRHDLKKERLRRLLDRLGWQPEYLPLHPM